MLVLDAAVAASWCFADEGSHVAAAAYELAAVEPVSVPALFWFELRNTLLMGERRARLTHEWVRGSLRNLDGLLIDIDRTPGEEAIFALALRHRPTVYDAAYLELAIRKRVPLATLDRELIAAARAEDVRVVGDSV